LKDKRKLCLSLNIHEDAHNNKVYVHRSLNR